MQFDFVYNTLSTRIIGTLIDQALAAGLFSIAFVFLRRATLDPSWPRSADFIKHLLLLFSVVLLFVYVDLAYEVEFLKGLHSPIGQNVVGPANNPGSSLASQDEQNAAKLQLLLLIPVDLVGITLMASLFGVILVFGLNQETWSGPTTNMIRQVTYLLIIMIAWRISMICWWGIYRFSLIEPNSGFAIPYDILIYIGYILTELAVVVYLIQIMKRDFGKRWSGLISWCAVLFFTFDLLSFYVIRLWDYAGRFLELIAATGSPS